MYCGWLGFELVFVILFTVETRGKTPEEIAVLFDGKRKPDYIPQPVYNNFAIPMDSSPTPSSIEHGEDPTCTCKERAAETYELEKPLRVVDKDRLGHGKARVGGL